MEVRRVVTTYVNITTKISGSTFLYMVKNAHFINQLGNKLKVHHYHVLLSN